MYEMDLGLGLEKLKSYKRMHNNVMRVLLVNAKSEALAHKLSSLDRVVAMAIKLSLLPFSLLSKPIIACIKLYA